MKPDFARAADSEPEPDRQFDDYAADQSASWAGQMTDSYGDSYGNSYGDSYGDNYSDYAVPTPLDFGTDHMTKLGLTLDFGPAELAANREGWLTEAQIARLATDLRWFYWPMIITLVVVAFVIGAASAAAGTLSAVPFGLLGTAAIPAVLLKLERERLPQRQVQVTRLRMGRFSKALRRMGVVGDEESFGAVRYPVEGNKPLFGPHHLYSVLQANQAYVAYYVPVRTWHGYRLLSLEPVDVEKAKIAPKRKAKRL